jgi:transcriptional regulator with XRE-family HTH domain
VNLLTVSRTLDNPDALLYNHLSKDTLLNLLGQRGWNIDAVTCREKGIDMKGVKFGQYLKMLREARDVTLRELSRQTGLSAPYLSDVENDRSQPLTKDRIEKVISVLQLSEEEQNQLFDLAGRERNEVAADLPEYIMDNDYVTAALRTARDLKAGEEEWQRFVDELKKREGQG